MRAIYEERIAEKIEIEGRLLSGRPWLFTDFAKLCWPEKTAAQLASIAGRDERTAKRWLSGEFEPPICVVIAIMNRMFDRKN